MSLPIIIAVNQTISDIALLRLGATVPGSGTLTLTEFSFEFEIKTDMNLYDAVLAGNITFDFGQGDVGTGDSIKFYNRQSQEARQPVRGLSNSNIASMSGLQTIDGVSFISDDRSLLVSQTNPIENGIWVIKVGAWERSNDMAVGQSCVGAIVGIIEGDVYSGQIWFCNNQPGDIVGTDGITFCSPSNNRRIRLEKMFNDAFDDHYCEFTYVGDNLTAVEVWEDSGKTTKLFTRTLSYTGDNLTTVATTDEQSSEILSTTFSYSGDNLVNITKVIT